MKILDGGANVHGLTRHIGADVAREVRRACGFGCVLCGRLPYTYDHFDPEFRVAREHNSDGIALLCFNHHAERTAGRLSINAVSVARRNPACLATGAAHYERPIFHGSDVVFDIGGNQLRGKRCQLAFAGRVLFGISAPDGPNQPWLFDGELHADQGRAVIRFRSNELELIASQWDVRLEGTFLQINRGPTDVVARVEFDGAANVVRLTRLKVQYSSGLTIEVGSGFIELRNLHHTERQNSMSCLRIVSSTVISVPASEQARGVAIMMSNCYGNRFGKMQVANYVTFSPGGVADLAAIATLSEFVSPDQLAAPAS